MMIASPLVFDLSTRGTPQTLLILKSARKTGDLLNQRHEMRHEFYFIGKPERQAVFEMRSLGKQPFSPFSQVATVFSVL